jgi:Fic family protein
MPPERESAALEKKLDLLISLLRIAHAAPLAVEREAVLSDSISRAALAASEGQVDAGALKKKVIAATKSSPATVSRRLAELVEKGVLQRSGSGSQVTYQSTGLFEP